MIRTLLVHGLLLLCLVQASVNGRADDRSAWLIAEPVPDWIWDAEGASEGQEIYLRKRFTLAGKPASARLYTTCDNRMTLWINGKKVGHSRDWPYPIERDVFQFLSRGENTIAVEAENAGGPAGFVFKLVVELRGNDPPLVLVSDPSWKMTRRRPPTRDPTRGPSLR